MSREWKTVFLLAAAFLSPNLSSAMGLARGPYVENPTQDSALVRWRTEISTVTWMEYGPQPNCSKTMTISAAAKDHAIKLFDLLPATTYCYRLLLPYNDGANSVLAATGTFSTLRPPEQVKFDFLVFGNTGADPDADSKLAAAMIGSNADFAIHTGNLFPSGKDSEADAAYFTPYAPLLAQMPVFITPGTDEYGHARTTWASKVFFKNNYKRYHQMSWGPGSPNYYSFKNGNCLFLVLDTNFASGTSAAPEISSGSAQYQWLKNTLSKGSYRWKFVFTHEPIYSNGAFGAAPDMSKDLSSLFEKYRVNLVFQGKDNVYERTVPLKEDNAAGDDGIVYVTAANSGRASQTPPEPGPWTAKLEAVPHFVAVSVSYNSALLRAYSADGMLLDETTISR